MNTYILLIIAIILVLLAIKLPLNKYVNYIMLVVGMAPISYFYVIKYYYKDYEPNTAGAFIMFATMCSVLLFEMLKNTFSKMLWMLDIATIGIVTSAACYMIFYGSKITLFMLVAFFVIRKIIPFFVNIVSNKIIYYICVAGLILGSIVIYIATRGNHDGFTYMYSKGGTLQFILMVGIVVFLFISINKSAFVNKYTISAFSALIICFILLWFDSSFVRTPLIGFLLILGYTIRNSGGIEESQAEKITQRKELVVYEKKEKLITALVLAVECSIGLFILGPLEIFAGNQSEFYFGFSDFALNMILIAVVSFGLIFVLLYFIKGQWFKYASYFVFMIEVCMYIQIMFMNIKLQEANGSNMDWGQLRWFMPINLIIWIGLSCIIVILSKTSFCKRVTLYGGTYLILVQLVAAISLLPSTIMNDSRANSVFSNENQYVLAKDENIVLFIVDAFARDNLEEYLERKPELLSEWNDFTEYTNANSDYSNTFPSIDHMITAYEYDENDRQWQQNAWKSEKSNKFFDKLHSLGWQFNLYTSETAHIGTYEDVNGKIDNIKLEKPKINKSMICKLLSKASLYRSLPYYVKPRLEVYSYQYEKAVDFASPCAFMNYEYYAGLKDKELSISDHIDKQISVTHILGYHYPFSNDENVNYLEDASSDQVIEGIVYMLDEYLGDLKKIGKYDDTTIIITADHADIPREHPQPIFFIKKKGEKHEKMDTTNAPIRHRDIQATLIKLVDEEDTSFGPTIWDFAEDEIRPRTLEGQDWGWNEGVYWKIEYAGDESTAFEEMRKNGIIE